jgi:hypothetical protein
MESLPRTALRGVILAGAGGRLKVKGPVLAKDKGIGTAGAGSGVYTRLQIMGGLFQFDVRNFIVPPTNHAA